MPSAAAKVQLSHRQTFNEMSLLIIDDEPFNVEILEEILLDAGYNNIHGDTNSRIAIELCQKHKPDLLLLDLQMPEVDGFEVMKRLNQHQELRNVPVLVITAQTSQDYRINALSLGAKDYLTKPFDQTEVLTRIHNLLETRHFYNNLCEQNQELNRVNNTMSELVSVVSHELRTPLTSIKSFVDILKDDDGDLDSESKKQFLDIIDNESDRLGRLISNLLDVQKIRSGKMSWKTDIVDLVKTLEDTRLFFSPAYEEKGLSIKMQTDLRVAKVLSDTDKLRQVITNLLSNALKFTENGGVTITVKRNNTWANIILVSKDAACIAPLTEVLNDLFTIVAHFPNDEEVLAHLEESGSNVDLLLFDISDMNTNSIAFLETIRSSYPSLSIITISGEDRKTQSDVKLNKSITIRKPINLTENRANIELLINDTLKINSHTGMIEVIIEDTGVGIPVKDLNKVFEHFHQVDSSHTRQQGGTGLGLTICNEIIEHYQGRIWVESEMGRGSKFRFILPELQQEKKRLGEVLVERGLVTQKQLSDALKNQ